MVQFRDGCADAWLMIWCRGESRRMAMAQTLGMSNDLIAREVPVDQPGLYLAVSHNSACNDPWLRGQLAKKMTEL